VTYWPDIVKTIAVRSNMLGKVGVILTLFGIS